MSEHYCPNCKQLGYIEGRGNFEQVRFACGAWANPKSLAKHGADALVEYNAHCEAYRALHMCWAAIMDYEEVNFARTGKDDLPDSLQRAMLDAFEALGRPGVVK